MAAADAELAQPAPDAGLVAVGADLAVSAECVFEVADSLVPVAVPAVQDAEVFGRGGPGPRIGVLRGGLGQAGRVAAARPWLWAAAAARAGNPGLASARAWAARAARAASSLSPAASAVRTSQAARAGSPSRSPGRALQVGAKLAEVAEGGGRAVACLGDLGLGQGGFGARVEVGELPASGRAAGEVLGRGREVAAAQLDHGQHAVRGRGVPVRAEGLGDGQGRLAVGGGVGQPAGGQVDAGPQDGQRRLGRDAVQRRVVRGAKDILRLGELAQVDQGGGEREQRLDMAGIRGDPGAVARGVAQQLERRR